MIGIKIDIKENMLYSLNPKVLKLLLKDKTTKKNILWATDDYLPIGEDYAADQEIKIGQITGLFGNVIRPRIEKSKVEQVLRVRDKAEVFTPSWVCNKQNNLIDNAWFERNNVFNVETEKGWKTNFEKIAFPEGKTWQDYVMLKRLEITCGEAPYLASRYDTVTGELIPVKERIGLLDRKLRVISENVNDEAEWYKWAKKAIQCVYGYDWQGDNVLLARENILYTFLEFYFDKFDVFAIEEYMLDIAKVVCWNIWQMDGIKCVIPNSCVDKEEIKITLLGEEKTIIKCPGCVKNDHSLHTGIYAKSYDWTHDHSFDFYSMIKGGSGK